MTNASTRFRVLAATGVCGLLAAPLLATQAFAAEPAVEVEANEATSGCTAVVTLTDFEGTVPLSVAAEGDSDTEDFRYALAVDVEADGGTTETDLTILPQDGVQTTTFSVRAGDTSSEIYTADCAEGKETITAASDADADDAGADTDPAAGGDTDPAAGGDEVAPAPSDDAVVEEPANDAPAPAEEEAAVPAAVNSGIGGNSASGLVAIGVGGLAVAGLGAMGLRKRSA